MNPAQLEAFRQIAEGMQTEATDWQWIGPHMSQRMFGITQQRAEDYARRHGGEARRMAAAPTADAPEAAKELIAMEKDDANAYPYVPQNGLTLTGAYRFMRQVAALPEDLRGAFEVLFRNPQDAAEVVFTQFHEAGRLEDLAELLPIAQALRLYNADRIADLFEAWANGE